eukprot:SAG31_NODE_17095_length_683_cov_1.785959_1_plen_161_part_01
MVPQEGTGDWEDIATGDTVDWGQYMDIAGCLGTGRSAVAVKRRYEKLVQWSAVEDKELLELVQQEGTADWEDIANWVGDVASFTRSAAAVKRRYEKLTAVKTEPKPEKLQPQKPQPEQTSEPKKQQLAQIYYWSGAQVEAWLVEELGLGKVAEAAGGEVDG